jgi:hypothetical protein
MSVFDPRRLLWIGLSLLLSGSAVGCGANISYPAAETYTTFVATLPGEDLVGPCTFNLYVSASPEKVRGVLVIYDRADSGLVYQDVRIRDQVNSLHLALLEAAQCFAASYGDIQVQGSKGPGRALLTALTQFAGISNHPELANANVILYGFSAAGILAATTANYMPARVIGVIGYAAASPYLQLNQVTPSPQELQIPFLLLSSAADIDAGTSRDQIFFTGGWSGGAPWNWGVQNGVGHCCALTTVPVILPWISAVAGARLSASGTLQPVGQNSGLYTTFTCTPSGVEDVTGYENCSFTAAAVLPAGASRPPAGGWLPNSGSAAEWLKWVEK